MLTAALLFVLGVVLLVAATVISGRAERLAKPIERLFRHEWWAQDRRNNRDATRWQVDGLATLLFILGGAVTVGAIATLVNAI